MKLKKTLKKHYYEKDTKKNFQTHPVEVILLSSMYVFWTLPKRLNHQEMEESKTE